ncbi:DUF3852 family protein (plasmid) [Oscillospiraceae bacterium MB08-C2-2]|nr:DUF3852 family protein [Oscillospiraceae bacterium MB08-C2-2]
MKFLSSFPGLILSANIQSGLDTAKGEIMDVMKYGVDKFAVPILAAVVVVVMLFYIGGAISQHRQGQDYQEKLKPIGICLVVLVLIVTFPVWGWAMIGQGQ